MLGHIGSIVAGCAFWAAILWAAIFALSKKNDVRWREVLTLGPVRAFFNPSYFIREERLPLVKAVGITVIVAFILAWTLITIAHSN